MVLPGAATNTLRAEQPLRDFTITMSRQRGIEGSHRQNEAPATFVSKRKRRCTKAAPFNGAPESVRRLQSDAGISVERQFDRKRRPFGRYGWQVKPMGYARQPDNSMPAI